MGIQYDIERTKSVPIKILFLLLLLKYFGCFDNLKFP